MAADDAAQAEGERLAETLLRGDEPIDSISSDHLTTLFSSFPQLSYCIRTICDHASASIDSASQSAKDRERFVALTKAYLASLPSTSAQGAEAEPRTSASSGDLEEAPEREPLLDTIWAVDQAYENNALGLEETALTQARAGLGEFVKDLHSSGILSSELLQQRLESGLLRSAGIITAQQSTMWTRIEPRIRTGMLYKQQKFNLLREESEGYSKLSVELLSSMGKAHDVETARPAEGIEAVRKRAARSMESIKALIGYFDLDPSRALDIILDIFADNILSHHCFFRELLSISPWGAGVDRNRQSTKGDDGVRQTMPDGSFESRSEGTSTVCSQILGFKFGWYASGEGAYETPSDNLYLLAAVLIWDGFVDLPSLWPHLAPASDEGMNKMKEKFKDDISDRIAAARSNALAMAGILADDSAPSASSSRMAGSLGDRNGALSIAGLASGAEKEPEKPAEPANARLGLLKALLSIGALQPAFWILSTYSWICDAHPEIADLLLRLCYYSISEYYFQHASPFTPSSAESSAYNTKRASLSQGRSRYSTAEKKVLPPQSTLHTISGNPEEPPRSTRDGRWREFTYFFAEWKDRLPICKNGEEVLEVVSQYLRLVGVHAGRNRKLLSRLLRIAKVQTVGVNATSASEALTSTRQRWQDLIRLHFIPALTLSEPNPSMAMELWDVLRNYHYTTRFAFYGEWKDRSYKRLPELRVRRAEAERDSKGLLRRLSIDNVKQFGRSLAKIAHTNPTVLFEIALNQVQSYDNLIGPVVESARYFTPFGYDVLAYSLLDALSNPEKERTKSDGTNISLWLQGLATFSGTLCKRWNIDVSYILQYILNQLRENNAKDLIVLRELISKMSGIEPVSDLSDAQVVALGGGKTLREEAINPTTAIERKGVTKRSTLRLRLALTDSGLAVPLLVAVALQRQDCIFGDEDAPLKYLGNLFDNCQQVLFQYLDFLLSQLGTAEYSALVPGVRDLWDTYKIDAGIAFHIVRPSLQSAIMAHDAAAKADKSSADMERLKEEARASRARAEAAKLSKTASAAPAADAATTATDESGEAVKQEADAQSAVPTIKTEDVEMKSDASPAPNGKPAVNGTSSKPKPIWHPALEQSIAVAEEKMSAAVKPYLSPGLFVSFWQLSLYDIFVPMERYQIEVERLNTIVREIDVSLKGPPSYPGQVIDRSGELEKRKSRERCMSSIQALNTDLKAHTEAYEQTRKRLQAEKAHWFMPEMTSLKVKEASGARRLAVQHFLQECINPRARLSPIDASFCARFIRVLHNAGAANFPSLHVYDRIFSEDLPAIIFHCTEGEARNYARFLHDCYSDLSAWLAKDSVYKKQAIAPNLPGFQRVWGIRKPDEPIPDKDFLQYHEFRLINQKWHKKTADAFSACIESRDYMCIRNAILILTKVAKFFPLFQVHGNQLESVVSALIAEEKREDLKVLALGYSALLKKQSATWTTMNDIRPSAASRVASPAVPTTNSANVAAPVNGATGQSTLSAAAAAVSPAPPAAASPAPSASASSSSLPTGPKAVNARTVRPPSPTASPAPAPSGGSTPVPASRPAGLPARPTTESDRKRPEVTNGRPEISRRPSEQRRASENAAPNAPASTSSRTPHGLPPRPGSTLRPDARREGASSAPSSRPNSQPPTPVALRSDAMDVDEPASSAAPARSQIPSERPSGMRSDSFAKPARPASPEPRISTSRHASPPPKPSPTAVTNARKEKDIPQSPRSDRDRSSRREESDRPRRSRAGSEESSHSARSSRRDRGERERERADRDGRNERKERSERESRSERDNKERSSREKEREREREKEKVADKEKESGRDRGEKEREGREKERERHSDRHSSDRHGDRSSRRDRQDSHRSERDRDSNGRKESERKDKDREKEKEKEREKEKDRGDKDREKDRESSRRSSRRDERDRERDRSKDEKRSEEKERDRAKERERKPDESKSAAQPSPSLPTPTRDLKRTAEQPASSTTKVEVTKSAGVAVASPVGDDHDSKRRRVDERPVVAPVNTAAPPSGPRADRPPPLSALPSVPSRPAGSTSIKGRALGAGGDQGMKIKSAASALNRAQQHNARMDSRQNGPRSSSVASGAETPEGASTPVQRESAPRTPASAPAFSSQPSASENTNNRRESSSGRPGSAREAPPSQPQERNGREQRERPPPIATAKDAPLSSGGLAARLSARAPPPSPETENGSARRGGRRRG